MNFHFGTAWISALASAKKQIRVAAASMVVAVAVCAAAHCEAAQPTAATASTSLAALPAAAAATLTPDPAAPTKAVRRVPSTPRPNQKPAQTPQKPVQKPTPKPAQFPDTIAVDGPMKPGTEVVEQEIISHGGKLHVVPVDSIPVLTVGEMLERDSIAAAQAKAATTADDEWVPRELEWAPNPTRAAWLGALFPGLGQVYNRRYWKLPIIVGGYLGLAYATNWNNSMLRDYTKAYADLLDNDPNTKAYMDLFSPNVKEESLDKTWLKNVINTRKNYFRRNRDLCVISMVGVYLLAIAEAYVDASLSHFDISPDLTMDVAPRLIQDARGARPTPALVWALNF